MKLFKKDMIGVIVLLLLLAIQSVFVFSFHFGLMHISVDVISTGNTIIIIYGIAFLFVLLGKNVKQAAAQMRQDEDVEKKEKRI